MEFQLDNSYLLVFRSAYMHVSKCFGVELCSAYKQIQ